VCKSWGKRRKLRLWEVQRQRENLNVVCDSGGFSNNAQKKTARGGRDGKNWLKGLGVFRKRKRLRSKDPGKNPGGPEESASNPAGR